MEKRRLQKHHRLAVLMAFLARIRKNEQKESEEECFSQRGRSEINMQTLIGNKRKTVTKLTASKIEYASQITQFNFYTAKQTCFRFTERACLYFFVCEVVGKARLPLRIVNEIAKTRMECTRQEFERLVD